MLAMAYPTASGVARDRLSKKLLKRARKAESDSESIPFWNALVLVTVSTPGTAVTRRPMTLAWTLPVAPEFRARIGTSSEAVPAWRT